MPSEQDSTIRWQPRPWQLSLIALMVIITICAVIAALWPPPTRSLYLYDAEREPEFVEDDSPLTP